MLTNMLIRFKNAPPMYVSFFTPVKDEMENVAYAISGDFNRWIFFFFYLSKF